jgi:hypothetical protein
VSDQAKKGVRNSTVGGRPPKTLSAGIKRTAGSHPKERVLGGLPRALPPIRNSRFPPTESSARHSALSAACLRWDGSLRSALFPAKACRRQGLGRSRLLGLGERVSYQPNSACRIKSELLQLLAAESKPWGNLFSRRFLPRRWILHLSNMPFADDDHVTLKNCPSNDDVGRALC